MPTERSSDVKFEIGHVLFIDIVGYSKLLINEQSEQIQKLKQIVRGTEQFRLAKAEGKLLRFPSSDDVSARSLRPPADFRPARSRWNRTRIISLLESPLEKDARISASKPIRR